MAAVAAVAVSSVIVVGIDTKETEEIHHQVRVPVPTIVLTILLPTIVLTILRLKLNPKATYQRNARKIMEANEVDAHLAIINAVYH